MLTEVMSLLEAAWLIFWAMSKLFLPLQTNTDTLVMSSVIPNVN